MNTNIADLAYAGDWAQLFQSLASHPEQVNASRHTSGYTPLHQAAWHGASAETVGFLIQHGADVRLTTVKKCQTAFEIAQERHPEREDLSFLLAPRRLSIAQLIRKMLSDTKDLFEAYDGNQLIVDKLIDCFEGDACPDPSNAPMTRLLSAFHAVTGTDFRTLEESKMTVARIFELPFNGTFFLERFFPLLVQRIERDIEGRLEIESVVVADLFDPIPRRWGLRGDLFLWMELRQTLARVSLPSKAENLEHCINSAYAALTNATMDLGDVFVRRLARGGMSSGMVSGSFWVENLVPILLQRKRWLDATWSHSKEEMQ